MAATLPLCDSATLRRRICLRGALDHRFPEILFRPQECRIPYCAVPNLNGERLQLPSVVDQCCLWSLMRQIPTSKRSKSLVIYAKW